MKNGSNLAVAIIAVIVILIGIYIVSNPDSERSKGETEVLDDDDASPRVKFSGGIIMVRLPETIQRQAGIETVNPELTSRVSGLSAFGYVVDLQSLIEFKSSYSELDADRKVAEAELSASTAEYDRLRVLHQNAANISDRQFQIAKAKWLSDTARAEKSAQKMENLRSEAAQIWGDHIIDATISNTEIFEKLKSGGSMLLLITLSANQHLPPGTMTITIRRSGNMTHEQQAFYISSAPYTQHLLQGETYYFSTQRGELRTGMHLDVWIPLADTSIQGIAIPESAVIWYVDRPWVYIQRDGETFFRLPLDKHAKTKAGWFVEEGIKSTDHIVTRGSQMLLSEEFRWSIPDEDDNP